MTAPALEAAPPKPPNNLVGLALLVAFLAFGAALQLTSLPKTPSGKIQRFVLRQQAAHPNH